MPYVPAAGGMVGGAWSGASASASVFASEGSMVVASSDVGSEREPLGVVGWSAMVFPPRVSDRILDTRAGERC
jgi:hypothetical protein